ncbi:MAG: sulfatase-like hydrolase/transferase, partial [Akkermansiaceae bacterium]
HGVTFGSRSSLGEQALSETYPMLLQQAGYFTGYVGKNHTPGIEQEHFDYWYGNHNHMGFYSKNLHSIYKNAKAHTQVEILQEGALNFIKHDPGFAGTEEFLKSRPMDKPFCLMVNFNVPHSFSVNQMRQLPSDPELYRGTYRDQMDAMPFPETYIAAADIKTPKIPREVYNGKYIESYDFVKTRAGMHERMVRTCQTVTGIDRLVGALVAELKAQDLYDNTIIVFTSDHGLQFGEHGLGGKVLLYEESLRVPLVIVAPRSPKAARGQRLGQLALSIDIAPTLLELAGLPVHPEMQGRSLVPLLRGEFDTAWREDFFAENMFMGQNYPRIEAVRGQRFKYIRYFDKKKDKPHHIALTASIRGEQPVYEELYDLKNDPRETGNLATDQAHRQTLIAMRQRCQALVTEAKGSDAYPKTVRI